MFIVHSTKEEVVNDELELIHTAKVKLNNEEYYFTSLTYITDKDIKRKIKSIKNAEYFEGSWDS